jgi:hypothetical protein
LPECGGSEIEFGGEGREAGATRQRVVVLRQDLGITGNLDALLGFVDAELKFLF